MAFRSLYFQETLHYENCAQELRNKFQQPVVIGSAGGSGTVNINNIGAQVQTGHATLVNGVVKIWSGDQGAIVLNTTSRIGFSISTYDNVDVPILCVSARTNGFAGVATFTVSSKKNENSSFDWYIFN